MPTTSKELADRVASLQDSNGCWNVLSPSDRNYPEFNYYVPNYKSTLWTLVLLADSKVDPNDIRFQKPLATIAENFFDPDSRIFSIGKSHFPIPCLNGNMIYLLSYFNSEQRTKIPNVVDFFNRYQRFDDGDFRTPSKFPYFSNRSCYGKHTCYWGVVKLLKGLVHIPIEARNLTTEELVKKAVDFILLHHVCFRSHSLHDFIHKSIQYLTFPNMYHSDFLEILWILKKANIKSDVVVDAVRLLREKMGKGGDWEIEKRIPDLVIPIGKLGIAEELISERAKEVLVYYGFPLQNEEEKI